MIVLKPSGKIAHLDVPMDKKILMEFNEICHTELMMSPEEVTRKLVYQVLIQSALRRGEA